MCCGNQQPYPFLLLLLLRLGHDRSTEPPSLSDILDIDAANFERDYSIGAHDVTISDFFSTAGQ